MGGSLPSGLEGYVGRGHSLGPCLGVRLPVARRARRARSQEPGAAHLGAAAQVGGTWQMLARGL